MEISAKRQITNNIFLEKMERNNSLNNVLETQKNISEVKENKTKNSFNINNLLKLIENLTSKQEVNKSFITSVNVPKGVNEIANKIINTESSSETSSAWNNLVSIAIESNNGIGSPESGFLAFSEEYGFINYLNPELSIEENKAIASKSLEAQISIENIESQINTNINLNINQEQNGTKIKNEKDKSFIDKAKDIFSFVSKGVKKVRSVINEISKVGYKFKDFSEYLKTSDYSFARKIGRFIDKGLSFIAKLF